LRRVAQGLVAESAQYFSDGVTVPESMYPQETLQVLRKLLLISTACLVVSGCKIEHKSAAEQQKGGAPSGSFENKSFNPKAEVAAFWESKAIPAITAMALDFPHLRKEMEANLDAVGVKHGHREKGEGAPWNLATRLTGTVVDVETEVSAGTADIDVDGDGKADVQIQIGPVVRGATIRDILPFISFTSYTNQIDFAQLANALNDRAYEASSLKAVDRSKLKGKKVELTGVFTADGASDLPVITVTAFKVLSK
jgi:predicted lipoprotein